MKQEEDDDGGGKVDDEHSISFVEVRCYSLLCYSYTPRFKILNHFTMLGLGLYTQALTYKRVHT